MKKLLQITPQAATLLDPPPVDLAPILEGPGFAWLDLAGEPAESIRGLAADFGLDDALLEEAVGHDLLPRIDHHGEYVSLVLHNPVSGQGRLDTSQVFLFFGPRFLVTVHQAPSPAIELLLAELGGADGGGYSSSGQLAAHISQLISQRIAALLVELDDRIDDLEGLALLADPRALSEVYVLRRDVTLLRRAIGPQREALRELARPTRDVADETTARAFDNVYDHQVRIAESLDAARSLLTSVLETYRGAVADQTNEIVRVLTVFSATLLPLSLIAGAWGMNFRVIPGQDARWGFLVLLGIMLAVATGSWFYFVRRGFIGRPRLRELPKALGLGLVQIGVAPIRLVASGIETTVRSVSRSRPEDHGEGRPEGSHQEDGPAPEDEQG